MLRKECDLYSTPLPWYYCPAFENMSRRSVVYYPIGIHWIVKWLVRLWTKAILYSRSKEERLLRQVYDAGYEAGFKCGLERHEDRTLRRMETFLNELEKYRGR